MRANGGCPHTAGATPWGGALHLYLPEGPGGHPSPTPQCPWSPLGFLPLCPAFRTAFTEITDSEGAGQSCLSPEPHLMPPMGTGCPKAPVPARASTCTWPCTCPRRSRCPAQDSTHLTVLPSSQACAPSKQFSISSVSQGLMSVLKLDQVLGKIKSNSICKTKNNSKTPCAVPRQE